MTWLSFSFVFLLIFLVLFGPALMYLIALSVMKFMKLYGRWIELVFDTMQNVKS
jgi:hypothetical protein